jgi:hypothetical protein
MCNALISRTIVTPLTINMPTASLRRRTSVCRSFALAAALSGMALVSRITDADGVEPPPWLRVDKAALAYSGGIESLIFQTTNSATRSFDYPGTKSYACSAERYEWLRGSALSVQSRQRRTTPAPHRARRR